MVPLLFDNGGGQTVFTAGLIPSNATLPPTDGALVVIVCVEDADPQPAAVAVTVLMPTHAEAKVTTPVAASTEHPPAILPASKVYVRLVLVGAEA